MKPADFRAPQTGKVIRTPKGYFAFIPAPLPPEIVFDARLVMALSQADAALSELSGSGRHLPNPHLLTTPYIRREAVLSSRIEGTKADLSDLWLGDVESNEKHEETADVQEVRNYVGALEYGIRRLADLPLSLRLVREIHAHLMEGVRGEQATPGEFRRSQNWIGPAGSTLVDAAYVPPPPDELMAALGKWEEFLQERDRLPDLVQCALLHEQFEAIHPFLDGNGRVGRLLITLFLMERSRLSQPLLYLSSYIEAHRQDYYDLLQRVRTQGDWNAWILFFLIGVKETARQALRQTSILVDLRERYNKQLLGFPKAANLLDQLFVNPYITVSRAERELKTSNPTARKAIEIMEEFGILRETTGREWGKVYLASAIADAIQESSLKTIKGQVGIQNMLQSKWDDPMERTFISAELMSAFCQKHHIRRLALFGSVVRDDFRPESDIDVLVEFEEGHTPGFNFFTIEAELSGLLGRKVDLQTNKFLGPEILQNALAEAVVAYEQA